MKEAVAKVGDGVGIQRELGRNIGICPDHLEP